MRIHQRVARLEAGIGNRSINPILLHEPADESGVLDFDREVIRLTDAGYTVIVQTAGQAPRKRKVGVRYVADDFNAQLLISALTPDPEHGNRLQGILLACKTTLPIAKARE